MSDNKCDVIVHLNNDGSMFAYRAINMTIIPEYTSFHNWSPLLRILEVLKLDSKKKSALGSASVRNVQVFVKCTLTSNTLEIPENMLERFSAIIKE